MKKNPPHLRFSKIIGLLFIAFSGLSYAQTIITNNNICCSQTLNHGDPISTIVGSDSQGSNGNYHYEWISRSIVNGQASIWYSVNGTGTGKDKLFSNFASNESGVAITHEYVRIVSISADRSYSNIVSVTINPNPNAITNNNITVGSGGSGIFNGSVPSGGNGNLTYQWYYTQECSGNPFWGNIYREPITLPGGTSQNFTVPQSWINNSPCMQTTFFFRLVRDAGGNASYSQAFNIFGDNASDYFNPTADFDNDGVEDNQDNCQFISNANQLDTDNDGFGDVCDDDDDNDGILDIEDNCPKNSNVNQEDSDGDGIGNACDFTTDLPDLVFDNITIKYKDSFGSFIPDPNDSNKPLTTDSNSIAKPLKIVRNTDHEVCVNILNRGSGIGNSWRFELLAGSTQNIFDFFTSVHNHIQNSTIEPNETKEKCFPLYVSNRMLASPNLNTNTTYYFLIDVDPGDILNESDEGNNRNSASFTFVTSMNNVTGRSGDGNIGGTRDNPFDDLLEFNRARGIRSTTIQSEANKPYQLDVFNMYGQKVKTVIVSSKAEEKKIISEFSRGLYIIKKSGNVKKKFINK